MRCSKRAMRPVHGDKSAIRPVFATRTAPNPVTDSGVTRPDRYSRRRPKALAFGHEHVGPASLTLPAGRPPRDAHGTSRPELELDTAGTAGHPDRNADHRRVPVS